MLVATRKIQTWSSNMVRMIRKQIQFAKYEKQSISRFISETLLPRAEIRKRKVSSIRNDCPLSLRTVTRESINDKKDMNQGPATLNASPDPST